VDFPSLLPLFPKSCVMVFELSPRTTADDLRAAVDRWIALFNK
jgi:hypothetical protein